MNTEPIISDIKLTAIRSQIEKKGYRYLSQIKDLNETLKMEQEIVYLKNMLNQSTKQNDALNRNMEQLIQTGNEQLREKDEQIRRKDEQFTTFADSAKFYLLKSYQEQDGDKLLAGINMLTSESIRIKNIE